MDGFDWEEGQPRLLTFRNRIRRYYDGFCIDWDERRGTPHLNDFDLLTPLLVFIEGVKDSGKSNTSEFFASQALKLGCHVVDMYGAYGGESLAWLRSEFAKDRKFLILHGRDVKINLLDGGLADRIHKDGRLAIKKTTDFSVEDLEEYDIVLSTSLFYSSMKSENENLDAIVERLAKRLHWKTVCWTIVREAADIFFSRLRTSFAIANVKQDTAALLRKAKHAGVGMFLDTQALMDVDKSIRRITDFFILKSQGYEMLPDEMAWLYKYVSLLKSMRLEKNECLVVSRESNVGEMIVPKVNWHKERREDMLEICGIEPEILQAYEIRTELSPLEHFEIVNLYKHGASMVQIAGMIGKVRGSLSSWTVDKQIQAHNKAVVENKSCPLCAQIPENDGIDKQELVIKTPRIKVAPVISVTGQALSSVSSMINEPDEDFKTALKAELIAQGYDQRLVESFFAKYTDQNFAKTSTAELARNSGMEPTEFERGFQDIKLILDSTATNLIRKMKPELGQVSVKIMIEGREAMTLFKAYPNAWIYSLQTGSWISKGLRIQQQQAQAQVGVSKTEVTESKEDSLRLSISKEVQVVPSISSRTVEASKSFGLGVDQSKTFKIFDDLQLEIKKGDVIYITGDSGSGKSTLLKELKPILEQKFGKVVCEGNPSLNTLPPPTDDEIVIEKIGSDFQEAVKILSWSGLSEAFIMMRKYSELSDGQKYRYRIARAINDKESQVWMFDEFGATLDRVSAKAISYTIQNAARKLGKTLIVATTHEDLFADLNPTLFVRKEFGSQVLAERLEYSKRECSLLDDLVIREGTREELELLEEFHYKSALPTAIRRLYIAEISGRVVGGIAYVTVHPNLKGRSIAVPEYTGTMNKDKLAMLNRDFLRIARVIIQPKYRGIGLGVKIVKETMPMTGFPFIETLAVMAKYNPFFEHAGMIRIQVPSVMDDDPEYAKGINSLASLGFEIDLLASANYNRSVLERLNEEGLRIVQAFILKHLVTKKYGGMGFKAGVEALDRDVMAEALTKAKLDMAYLIWRSPDPKFAHLPQIRA
jgi:ABC-type lipoprotein export system ATPase subunit/GNAT superfamily N-acetyltransferase